MVGGLERLGLAVHPCWRAGRRGGSVGVWLGEGGQSEWMAEVGEGKTTRTEQGASRWAKCTGAAEWEEARACA